MVLQPDGVNNVNIEYDKEIVDVMQRIISCMCGKKALNYVIISGSVAQGLKCENSRNRGDVDVLVISEHPQIKLNEQMLYLVGQPEPGFFKIKTSFSGFPVVQRNGEFYLSASSLRNLESIWLPSAIKMALVILDKQQELYHIFYGYDKPVTGVASSIKWKSQLGPIDEEIYFKILRESYMENVFHLPTKPQKDNVKKALNLISKLFVIDRLYVSVDILKGKERIQNIEAEIGESGMITEALQYLMTKFQWPYESVVDAKLLDCFEMICHYFDNSIQSQINATKNKKRQQRDTKIRGYIDVVPVISCEGFPVSIAADWSKRVAKGNWPEKAIVDEVLNGGFHLVPKTSKSKAGDSDADFRISFSTSETVLAQSLTRFQKECYRIFKMYYYEQLKSDPAVLEAYHLKTILFWLLEEMEPKFWSEENRVLAFYVLMNKLFNHLKEHELPHYFIPQSNLFQYLDTRKLDDLAQVVEDIMKDPVGKTGEKIEEVMEYYKLKNMERKKGENSDITDSNLLKEQHLIRKTALQTLADSTATELQFEIQNIVLNSGDVKNLLEDRRTRSLLMFCFDVIYAKHAALVTDYSSKADREKFLHSPFAIFTLLFLPLSDSILKEVFCKRHTKDNQTMKKINDVERFMD